MQFDTMVNYMAKELGNNSYVDVNNFGKAFGEQRFDEQHLDERFDVSLEQGIGKEDFALEYMYVEEKKLGTL